MIHNNLVWIRFVTFAKYDTPHSTEIMVIMGGQFFCDRIDDEYICESTQLHYSPGTTGTT